MGKILVKGKAERQYEADICVIDLTITTNHSDSSAATKEADKTTEELLQAMEQISLPGQGKNIRFPAVSPAHTKTGCRRLLLQAFICLQRPVFLTGDSLIQIGIIACTGNGTAGIAIAVMTVIKGSGKMAGMFLRGSAFPKAVAPTGGG